MTIYGLDVSEHQSAFDFHRARAEGYDFVILRTNDGTYRDHWYQWQYDAAKAAGYGDAMAAYFYLRHPREGASIAQQVNLALNQMTDGRRLPMWIDVETDAVLSAAHVREAKRLLESAGIYVPGVYTGKYYWDSMGQPDSREFGAVWLSHYGINRIAPASIFYAERCGDAAAAWNLSVGGQTATILQFSSNGVAAGRVGGLDVNAYRGTLDELIHLFTGKEPEMQFDQISNRYPSRVKNADPAVTLAPIDALMNADANSWEANHKLDALLAEMQALKDEISRLKESK